MGRVSSASQPSGGHYDHPDMCESALFLRVVSKNVPIFRPDDGNVAESLSRFNSTFSLKNNTTWHVTDHFYTHNVNDHVNHPINQQVMALPDLEEIARLPSENF